MEIVWLLVCLKFKLFERLIGFVGLYDVLLLLYDDFKFEFIFLLIFLIVVLFFLMVLFILKVIVIELLLVGVFLNWIKWFIFILLFMVLVLCKII